MCRVCGKSLQHTKLATMHYRKEGPRGAGKESTDLKGTSVCTAAAHVSSLANRKNTPPRKSLHGHVIHMRVNVKIVLCTDCWKKIRETLEAAFESK